MFALLTYPTARRIWLKTSVMRKAVYLFKNVGHYRRIFVRLESRKICKILPRLDHFKLNT